MDLVSRFQLAERLGVTAKAMRTLINTGVVRETITSGRNVYVTEAEADRLCGIEELTETPEPSLLVKVTEAKFEDSDGSSEERAWTGWNPGIPADHKDQMDGVRMWWGVNDPDRYVGHLLVPIAAGFVLAVYEVIGYRTGPAKLRAFDIKPATDARAHPLVDHRFPTQRGSLTDPR
ncbi:MerR family transcriptional regulator [Rhodococcus erythropolis]|jgi:hypothetical protein|uniref:MerR family transcriptional regulator n=1 Tax=Rhodococcus erythropolis TaxID=1833 RepID=UPI0018A24B5C|nr:MerR family transcriptional regulator [Rhodococcus erythropolis]MBF7737461.1 MerR family transcriptional regulator [Rhodococcus erythropolis]MCZ4645243.1 hypothetical protein [Rhodococcus erythropolis]